MYPVYSRPVRTAVFFGLLMTIYTIAGLETFSTDHLTEDDIGHFNVCGPPGVNLNVTWHPKVINITANLNLSVEMVAPISFESGVVHVELYPDGNSVLVMDTDITCGDIKKDAHINCPIQPETYWSGTFDIHGTKDFPQNTYFLKIIVTNENRKVFGCLNATIEITE